MGRFCLQLLLLVLSNSIVSGVYSAATFTFVNKCEYTVWPGILSNAGIAHLETTGFSLQTGETRIIRGPPSWGGRFWGRTQCNFDSTGKFSCFTGDCGSGKVECAGGGAAPPATLAEFTLDGDAGKDFYDVSLVDGYNVPMLLVPQGGSGENCTKTGCIRDLNSACPASLQVMISGGERVACKSACEAFGNDEYCCVGAYGTPQSCQPTQYSQLFKNACPLAYSYAYDDSTSTFTCTGADYIVMFCPSPNTSQKLSSGGGQNESEQPIDSAMVYQGAWDVSGGAPPPTYGRAVVIAAALWLLRYQL
ncbi:thaumatin-like protein 1b [Primulina tabacum]|uniref:thaumatin-like protein 1b n=1 Tax=Primulina tabacum TaxID=48773 RepID=UPI003F5A6C1D